MAALTIQQIQQPLHGTSFSQWRSSCSSMGMASFSKYSGSSLAFARGLLWRQAAEARVDVWPKMRWQCARAAKSWLDLFKPTANAEDGKP
jgi:hypothetical protein